MPGKLSGIENIQGLTKEEVAALQRQFGKNIFRSDRQYRFLRIIRDIVREPMFILLVVACSLYFILGNTNEGIMMAVAMVIVSAISLSQEVKSSRALESLKQFTQPKVTVVRDGIEQVVSNEDLVPGDIILLEEGMRVPADAKVLQSNDLSVNESIVTGESLPAEKSEKENANSLYQGTTINSGKCTARVAATGNNTLLGKIGKSVSGYNPVKTLLQVQVNRFVRRLALFGLAGFLIIFLVNYLHYREFATSLLFALTLAMSAVPEEIPVAFSSFMALGAYKMSKLGIISRQPQIIENLGAVSVLCLDKTGTITENKMEVKTIYDAESDQVIDLGDRKTLPNKTPLLFALLASEESPFDSMEKAIGEAYYRFGDDKVRERFKMIHEYPLEGQPPMMTHVYESADGIVVAAKGGSERIFRVCHLDETTVQTAARHARELASQGYRVLGIARAAYNGTDYPASQDDFNWQFLGLLALYDPPKKNSKEVLKNIGDAGVKIKLLTGDFPATAVSIAKEVGMLDHGQVMKGEEVMSMTDEELRRVVNEVSVFARMFPDAKLKVINALRANNEIVAMTGDGINDAPALKASDIGIAMGKRGTETARQAADLVLTDDNLGRMVTAISQGRKIFSNLVKAVRYIISIHIPIILTASLPVVLGWTYPNIFTPIHVIFLELIMGPTCSIFFENEPVEKDSMQLPPRDRKTGLFKKKELLPGIVLGLTITAGVLTLYYVFMTSQRSIEETRAVVFTTLILANVFLTFSSRSFTRTFYYTSRYKNRLSPIIIIVSLVFLAALHFIPPVRGLFQLAPIAIGDFLLCTGVAFASVAWFEVYKMSLRK